MAEVHTESLELWRGRSDYWGLLKDKRPITAIWHAAIAKAAELGLEVARIENQSIREANPLREMTWIKYDNGFDPNIISIPTLVGSLTNPKITYFDGVDYTFDTGEITWISEPLAEPIYAPSVFLENDLIEKSFNNGFLDLDLSGFNPEDKRCILELIWFSAKTGVTDFLITSIINALAGLPFMHKQGYLSFGDDKANPSYSFISKAFKDDSGMAFYSMKLDDQEFVISNNRVVADNITQDCVLSIDNVLYSLVEMAESSSLIFPSIQDGTYMGTIFTSSGITSELIRNATATDMESGDVFACINGSIPNLPNGDFPVLSIEAVGPRAEGLDLIPGIPISQRIGLAPVQNVDLFRAYHPIQQAFETKSWIDNIPTSISSLAEKKRGCIVNEAYNNESCVFLLPKEGLDEASEIELSNSNLRIGGYLKIEENESISLSVESVTQSDNGSTLIVESSHMFKIGDTVIIISTHEDRIGHIASILNGSYSSGRYSLDVDVDLSGIPSGDLTLRAVDQRVRYVEIEAIDGEAVSIEGFMSINLDLLPVISTAKIGNYGGSTINPVSDVSGLVITIEGHALSKFSQVVLKDELNPSSIYSVVSISDNEITIDRIPDYTYDQTTLVAISIKNIDIHNGFDIRMTEEMDSSKLEVIENLHPEYKENINKALGFILPVGSKFEWRV